MPYVPMAVAPEAANQALKKVEQEMKKAEEVPLPSISPPPETVFKLSGGYLDDNGQWQTEFEVRELTGRDEEALSRVKDASRLYPILMSRGLVRVGRQKATEDVADGLLAGDWETILVAIRVVTFGRTVEIQPTCESCGEEYLAEIDLIDGIPYKTASQDEIRFEVIGRHGDKYEVIQPYASTQRKILDQQGLSIAEMNTLLLADCIVSVNDIPLLGANNAVDLPMADRRTIMMEIESKRVGPDLGGVRTACPSCGTEQDSPISVAALFQ